MMRKHIFRPNMIFILPLLLVMVSLGCGLSGLMPGRFADVTPTRTPMPTFTATPADAAFVNVEIAANDNGQPVGQLDAPPPPTETPTVPPTEVIEPTPTPPPPTETPTPGPPMVTIIQNMNVRTGPGTNYPIAGPGPAGEESPIIGRNADSSWVQVEYPPSNDNTGWVYADLVKISGSVEQISVVNVAPPPPPPTPTEIPPTPVPEKKYQFTPTGWHASENAAIVHFKGRIKDEGGNLVNGFSVLLNNGAWSVVSHPTGASHHYPEKGDGEWDVVIPDIRTGIGWWWLTVVTYDCPNFFQAFDAQCKQFTRLSEDVKIEVIYPEETIINADWTCHWDCNKGLYVDGYKR